ncbi:MAG: nuclear transport factor 2 family protein [Raineya sp.]|jgi:hypothetical protein|nr:nuclear transport factor 2 family protein [Raineya sp.]
MDIQKTIIQNYVEAYNNFDVEKMIENFGSTVIFENISGGVSNMRLEGIEAFKEQANQAKSYFETRKQTIVSWNMVNDTIEIELLYEATLAMDFPNGLKKGDKLNLNGKSIFKFTKENKILSLTDIS